MRLALDTNILAYAEGVGDGARFVASLDLIVALPLDSVVLPALGELYRVLTAKARREWSDTFVVADSTWTAFQSALDLASTHGRTVCPLAGRCVVPRVETLAIGVVNYRNHN